MAACVVCEHANNRGLLVGGVIGEKFERGNNVGATPLGGGKLGSIVWKAHLEAESG